MELSLVEAVVVVPTVMSYDAIISGKAVFVPP